MSRTKGFLYLLKMDIVRTFRDIRYVIFIVILPIIFYVFYTRTFDAQTILNGVPWSKYYMISMAAFGVIGNAVNFMGVRIQKERSENWYQFLKVSSIPEFAYNISRSVSYIILSLISIFLVFLTGAIFEGAILTVAQYVLCIGVLLIGSLVFVSLALIISCMGSAAHPIGTIVYLMLSFVGGLWVPIEAMPTFLQQIAKLTPSYNYAAILWNNLGGKAFPLESLVILFIWFIIFTAIYFMLLRLKRTSESY